ncbi:MAG TPA: 16S rRNA (cytosine(1402)-N(4))-methyltransferase, partial [Candidatus Paceibacterota bacterium]
MCRLNNREEGGMRQDHKHSAAARDDRRVARKESAPRNTPKTPEAHQTVMMQEALGALSPRDEDIIVDATAGAGGHSEMLLRDFDIARLIALDADEKAVANVTRRLAPFGDRAMVINANFGDIEKVLKKEKIKNINKALFDLGWNRTQLYDGRGLSFMNEEPLNMSYGSKPASGFTARDIVNDWSEETIADVIFGYGEERYARRIAKAIVEAREEMPIETTSQLVSVIER